MLLFSLIAVVFDLSERIEKFISKGLGFWEITSKYYFNFIPWINWLLFLFYALIPAIFFPSQLAGKLKFIRMFGPGLWFKDI